MSDITLENCDITDIEKNGETFIKEGMSDNKDEKNNDDTADKPDNSMTEIKKDSNPEPEKKSKKKRPRKKELIESLKKAYEKLGDEVPSNRKLSRTRVKILEKQLADATSRLTNKIIETKQSNEQKENISKIPNDMAVKSLYNLNVITAHTIEKLTGHFGEDYGVSLDGWTKNLCKEREEELKACLKEIIDKHGDQVKQYMDPIAIYLMLVITSASETIAINTKKKSKYTKSTTAT